jgi:hypothetical protein
MTKEFGRQMKKKAFQLFIESFSLTKVAFMENTMLSQIYKTLSTTISLSILWCRE